MNCKQCGAGYNEDSALADGCYCSDECARAERKCELNIPIELASREDKVNAKFMLWLMQENLKHEQLWRAHDERNEYADKTVNAINHVSDILKNWIATGKLNETAAEIAADSARAAAWAAEWSWAPWAASESARVAAWAAWAAAESARRAWSAADSLKAAERAVADSLKAAERAVADSAMAAQAVQAQAVEAAMAAEKDFRIRMSEKLAELLKEAPTAK
jgi:hypothetical protein